MSVSLRHGTVQKAHGVFGNVGAQVRAHSCAIESILRRIVRKLLIVFDDFPSFFFALLNASMSRAPI